MRKKSLASVELLLSSAQKQLASLLTSEPASLDPIPEPALAQGIRAPETERRLELNMGPSALANENGASSSNGAAFKTADYNHVSANSDRSKGEQKEEINETLSNSEPS